MRPSLLEPLSLRVREETNGRIIPRRFDMSAIAGLKKFSSFFGAPVVDNGEQAQRSVANADDAGLG